MAYDTNLTQRMRAHLASLQDLTAWKKRKCLAG